MERTITSEEKKSKMLKNSPKLTKMATSFQQVFRLSPFLLEFSREAPESPLPV